MTKDELAELELANLDAWIRRYEADVARLRAAKANYTPWEPTAAVRNDEGVMQVMITDPFEEAGHNRGTRYERVFDLASVAADELGEPVLLVWEHEPTYEGGPVRYTKVLGKPGESPTQLRQTQDTPLGRFITGPPVC